MLIFAVLFFALLQTVVRLCDNLLKVILPKINVLSLILKVLFN